MGETKRILQVLALSLCVITLFVTVYYSQKGIIKIGDNDVPLNESAGVLVQQTEADLNIIPDKYNTGVKGELTPVTSDVYISGVKFKTTKLDFQYQPSGVVIPSTILVENYDFSNSDFQEQHMDALEQKVMVIYRNCKFSSFVMSGSVGNVEHQFENCTFTHFAGSNATLTNCYFGSGSDGDGVNPVQNCTFINCMIADLIQTADTAGSKHIDGFQIFGSTKGTDNQNIYMKNCRFEIPALPLSTPSGAMNCPLSIIMRYSNAQNIAFEDCYVNGGLYYAIMVNAYDNQVTNLSLKNIRVGGASKNVFTSDAEFKDLVSAGVSATDSLYVASVRKLGDGIHLSVTNDTNKERTLSVLTTSGVRTIQIPACPKAVDIPKDSMTYGDFPFDLDIVIPDADWVVCFDTTDSVKQIRYVNWSVKETYANLEQVTVSEKEEVKLSGSGDSVSVSGDGSAEISGIELQGSCGSDVNFYLKNGKLTLSGSGKTYNYHSGKLSPWYDVKEEILEVAVEEGITVVGNQLFADCSNLQRVTFAEGVTTIGTNTFKRCSELSFVRIPRTMKTIGSRSFSLDIDNVEYAGTEEEWSIIDVGGYNDGLLEADIFFCASILYSGICGADVTWSYSADGTLTLSGQGATYNYHSGNVPPWYEFAAEVNKITISDGITGIGNYLFRDCKKVEKVVLPQTVTSVGINTFSRCKGLTELTCYSSLESIGKNAFAGTSFSKVYYYGTMDEWNAISGNTIKAAEIICK